MTQTTESHTETTRAAAPAKALLPKMTAPFDNQAKLPIDSSDLWLERAYHWEKERGDATYMTQPIGGGAVETFTWKRTLDEARRMAAHLVSLDLPPSSQIAILSKNCAHFIMTDLAIWMAGHVSVALYPTLPPETIRYVLEHSESKLLFVGKLDGWKGMKPGVPDDMPCISYPLSPKNDYPTWNDIVAKTEPIEGSPTRPADDMAILIYTSGSTGQPKGVAHDFGNLARVQKGLGPLIDVGPDDRCLSYLPLAHAFERAAIEGASIYHGLHVFFAESLDTFVQDLQRARPTLFQSVPRLWLKFQLGVFKKLPPKRLALLLKIPILNNVIRKKVLSGLGLQDTRVAVSGSAPIPAELIDWYRSLGLELLEGYAMSENFCYSHFTRPGEVKAGWVGRPTDGCDVKLSDEGEVLVKSPCNMQGYFKEPEMTLESFTEDGYLKTGDRGEVDENGVLRITGRVKELFKTSKGKYIAPAPIENLINADDAVELCCVTGSGHPQPFALVQLNETLHAKAKSAAARDEIAPALEALLKSVNERVAKFERLAFFAIVKDGWQIENGMLTPTMKIKRGTIEDRYAPHTDAWYEARKPLVWE
jgi:long-subunit acyl-CoA synthetase (AMP-forming)